MKLFAKRRKIKVYNLDNDLKCDLWLTITGDLQDFSTEAVVLERIANIGFAKWSPFATTSYTCDTSFLKTDRSFFSLMDFADQLLVAFEYVTLKRFPPDLLSACDNLLHKLKSIATSWLRATIPW